MVMDRSGNGMIRPRDFHDNDRDSDRRAKKACIRCRRRKTKCTGGDPCRTCQLAKQECLYVKKARKIQIFDTEIDEYKQEIRKLKNRVNRIESTGGDIVNSESDKRDELDLNIRLNSGSAELICWNLNEFINSFENVSDKVPAISPDFNTFLEENYYGSFLYEKSCGDFSSLEDGLKSLSLGQVEHALDNVVLFINSGYLTLDPIDFRAKLRKYFDSEGKYIPRTTIDYFCLQILIISSLGEIYGPGSSINSVSVSRVYGDEFPGFKYFKLVMKSLGDTFQTLVSGSPYEILEVLELFGLVAINLRCIDKKNAASMFTMNALQTCIALNLHQQTDFNRELISRPRTCRLWWATYCLNRFYTSRLGQPLLLKQREITIQYPYSQDVNSEPTRNDEFANTAAMNHYIELAKIAEDITNDLYCVELPLDNRRYLRLVLRNLEKLLEWAEKLPRYLKLRSFLSKSYQVCRTDRLVYSLHLNHLHHIYLTSIPVMLHFAKARILTLNSQHGEPSTALDLNSLPLNMKNMLLMCLNSSQLTVNIFMTLYKTGLLRSTGFTDLDYLYSSALVFAISLLIRLDEIANDLLYSLQEYLNVTVNLIREMELAGNLVAKGKLRQIASLLRQLGPYLEPRGHSELQQWLDNEGQFGTQPAPSPSVTAAPSTRLPVMVADKAGIPGTTEYILDAFKIENDLLDNPTLPSAGLVGGDFALSSAEYQQLFNITDEDVSYIEHMLRDNVS
ncbi:Piso0_002151 [Millerozyma farinosa CBS 7064]|uniref:Piso0_002151 protein n=1 Tax=Pichia sorbitophila (strain ATCC MYA-4447 / BCRC 22081 / CBS 7064 / NBRC 10061 / NRRL Y-12695) TaxID=559304 RepID=G8YBU4_PICSO|nr:Piso0_002151 [Millerozyma farinosa CBS 7064]